jgi:hypothetical protein
MLPNSNPFPNSLVIISSAAIKIDAVPAISLTIVQRDSCRHLFIYSNAKAVIFFLLKASK